ncbi:MAG: fibronectin type III domain-containing protein [Myxococcaceae bacterium]
MTIRLALCGGLAVTVLACGPGMVSGGSGGGAPAGVSAPSALEVKPMMGGGHVTWTDNSSNEDGFAIERQDGSGTYRQIATVDFNIVQYHDPILTIGVEYSYRVRAISAALGDSQYSNAASIMLMAANGGGAGGGGSGTGGGSGGGSATGGGAASGGGAATGGGSASGGGSGGGGVATVSFRNDVVPIFGSTCGSGNTTCHAPNAYAASAQFDCRGWLSLTDSPLGSTYNGNSTGCADRTLYQRLTELKAWMCEPQQAYVVAGSLAQSHLYQMIAGDPTGGGTCWKVAPMNGQAGVANTAMPPAPATISQADVDTIKNWILQGAQDN